jgi:soluble P-type ATPase
MRIDIPGHPEPYDIETVILDLNGTLTDHGEIIEGVRERIAALFERGMRLVLFTGDTLGNGASVAKELNLEMRKTPDAQAKADEANALRPETCATIGNGRIDLELFKTVRLRLLVCQREGACPQLLDHADAFYTSINDALDAFLKPKGLIATMRK